MWNVALEKRKMVWVFILPILKKASSVAAAERINTEDTVTSGEFKKQKSQELKYEWKACQGNARESWQG